MNSNLKHLSLLLVLTAVPFISGSCSDKNDDVEPVTPDENLNEKALAAANRLFVEQTVQPTYEGLAQSTAQMIEALELFGSDGSQSSLEQAAEAWKEARQYWEWSEAFLFGAASGYGIDPHIDTWPFDAASFTTYMSKYQPATDEDDASLMSEAIATGQNLTGFHAVEYLLFRDGQVRPADEVTADELWFCLEASHDLYLSASKLVSAWNGRLDQSMQTVLEEAEFEPAAFGEEFIGAGQAGSRWSTISLASVNIIEGCQDIIDEVAHSKIGAPYTGEDVSYIESPHAWNSITDFYDNIMSCKHALYGLSPSVSNYTAKSPATGSLMAYCQANYPTEAAAAIQALDHALEQVGSMRRPFVNYYSDGSAGAAIDALEQLDDALGALKRCL